MHNIQLVGIHHMDHFSLRGCFLVIGAFGVVTVISYINELAKAGLLSGSPRAYWIKGGGALRRSLEDFEDHQVNNRAMLHKVGNLPHLNIDLLPLKDGAVLGTQKKHNKSAEQQEIQIALRFDKKDRYVQADDSNVNIYQFHQTLPNFYLKINQSLQERVKDAGLYFDDDNAVHNFTDTVLGPELRRYRNHSKVLIYQHDPNGYAVRDCFLSLAIERNLLIAESPLNAFHRKNWEKLDRRQRENYDILYGGLSFGVCESLSEACSYAVMVTHPLKRLLQAYWLCKNRNSSTLCSFLWTENISNVYEFIERYGSTFFQNLLYYSRHCRLVGHNEMCIHDNNIYFVLSPDEKQAYLLDILRNLENWFSVVGIAEELDSSLYMIGTVVDLDFTKCLALDRAIPKKFFRIFHRFHHFHSYSDKQLESVEIDDVPFPVMHERLLRDSKVTSWLSADIAIYEKLVEIYHRQWSVYNELKRLMLAFYSNGSHSHQAKEVEGNAADPISPDVLQERSTSTIWPETMPSINTSTSNNNHHSYRPSSAGMNSTNAINASGFQQVPRISNLTDSANTSHVGVTMKLPKPSPLKYLLRRSTKSTLNKVERKGYMHKKKMIPANQSQSHADVFYFRMKKRPKNST